MLAEVDAIHLGERVLHLHGLHGPLHREAGLSTLTFAYKLQLLELSINSDKIQDNMTGTFDMRQREDGRIIFDQDTRK